MKRRDFLASSIMATLAQGLAGCGGGQDTLKVQLLRGSLPIQAIEEFPKWAASVVPVYGELSRTVDIQVAEQLKDVFENLQRSLAPPTTKDDWGWMPFVSSPRLTYPDLATLGDSWLQRAIAQKLIQPLPIQDLPSWQKLPRRWRDLVLRDDKGNPSTTGQVWGAPYRWGTTMIAYRRDKFQELGWTPQDWGDLWRAELKGKISLLDQPREVIGLTLKKLGKSYNTQNLAKIPSLKAELQALNHQAKFYSSDRYLQPLILEDTWAAVGWSGDMLPLVKRNPQIAAVIPQSGTGLWADLWVYPQGRELTPGIKSWIDFCWQPATANRIGLLSNATSPMVSAMRTEDLLPDLRSNPLLVPPASLTDRSEFLEPLPENVITEYLALWKEIRQRV